MKFVHCNHNAVHQLYVDFIQEKSKLTYYITYLLKQTTLFLIIVLRFLMNLLIFHYYIFASIVL